MSDITVNSMNIVTATREQVWLKSLLGNYELAFNFTLQGPPERDGKSLLAAIHSARVNVKSSKSGEHDLGLANLETFVSLKTHSQHSINAQITFYLPLANIQLSKIEDLRDGHDLEFKLMIKGTGGDGRHVNAIHNEWRVKIPRSEWIDRLKQAGYMDTLLLEVPMLPKAEISDAWIDIRHDLEEAQRHFLNREYSACVSQCRKVMEEAGHRKFGEGNWYNPLLDLIGTNPRTPDKDKKTRSGMSKEERENAIWASLLHYTHQSHHGKSKGGENSYTRADAKLILTLTAAFIAG